MKAAIAVFSVLLFAATAGLAASWSPAINGVRGRLVVLPPEDSDSPYCRVYIELQNVSKNPTQKIIRFTRGMTYSVTNKAGKPIPPIEGLIEDFTAKQEPLLLPQNGTIKFEISFGGVSLWLLPITVVDLGSPPNAWMIPPRSDSYLSGVFSIKPQGSDQPARDWTGALQLPRVKIPHRLKTPGAPDEIEFSPVLEGYLSDFYVIKIGMTRSEVEALFPTDGGIQGDARVRFQHKVVPSIKIDVDFELKKDPANISVTSKDDKVIKIGKPYFQRPFAD